MIDIAIKADTDTIENASISLRGDLTINNVDQLYQEISAATKVYKFLSVFCDQIDALDLSVIQLLYSFQTSHAGFHVDLKLNEEFKELLLHSGLVKLFKTKNHEG